jgi:hypothetical protein
MAGLAKYGRSILAEGSRRDKETHSRSHQVFEIDSECSASLCMITPIDRQLRSFEPGQEKERGIEDQRS